MTRPEPIVGARGEEPLLDQARLRQQGELCEDLFRRAIHPARDILVGAPVYRRGETGHDIPRDLEIGAATDNRNEINEGFVMKRTKQTIGQIARLTGSQVHYHEEAPPIAILS